MKNIQLSNSLALFILFSIFLFGNTQAVPFQTFSGVAVKAYKVPLINGDVIKVSISTFPVLPASSITIELLKGSLLSPATILNPILYNPNIVFSTSAISGTLSLTNYFVIV